MSELGKQYHNGEVIVRQGDLGECMYVVQKGSVEVLTTRTGGELRLATLGEGDFFGEMALFEREVRSATVRALGDVWVLTLEKKSFLLKVHQDPSLAFRILEKMSHRLRELNSALEKASARSNAA